MAVRSLIRLGGAVNFSRVVGQVHNEIGSLQLVFEPHQKTWFYQRLMAKAAAREHDVLGYVSLGDRPVDDIEQDIQSWDRLPTTGVFLADYHGTSEHFRIMTESTKVRETVVDVGSAQLRPRVPEHPGVATEDFMRIAFGFFQAVSEAAETAKEEVETLLKRVA